MTNIYQEREPMRCIPSLSADSPPLAIANSYEQNVAFATPTPNPHFRLQFPHAHAPGGYIAQTGARRAFQPRRTMSATRRGPSSVFRSFSVTGKNLALCACCFSLEAKLVRQRCAQRHQRNCAPHGRKMQCIDVTHVQVDPYHAGKHG